MPSRKLLVSALRGFLGTYVSRNSDLDGYLVFGLAATALDGMEVDLMSAGPAPSPDPVSEIRRLAVDRFADQLSKIGLPRSVVTSARLSIRKGGEPLPVPEGQMSEATSGSEYTFTVTVVTDLGHPYREERRALIAPHAPDVFARSARRGSG